MTEAWRCFVAVSIGERLRRDLASVLDGWCSRHDLAALRWSDPEAWHVTLAFLGDVEPEAVPAIARSLALVAARHEPFELATGGLGGFPTLGRARVAWYGVDDGYGRLRRLADEVGRAVDLDPDRQFTAHVTLARSRGRPLDLGPWVRDGAAPAGTLAVDHVRLMRSHQGRGPAHYETLSTAALGRRAR